MGPGSPYECGSDRHEHVDDHRRAERTASAQIEIAARGVSRVRVYQGLGG